MPISATLVRKLTALDPALRDVLLSFLEEMERQREQLAQQVTRAEFNELKEIVAGLGRAVAELVEAQKRSEERLTRLETTVAELIEAQKRTEQRVNELAEAQKRSEERLTRLETTVAGLIEAQKRSEERLTRLETTVAGLIEAQKRSEDRLTRLETTVAELIEAQKRTEEEIRMLSREVRVLRERVEGVSNAVGYTLEDRAFRSLPARLREEGVEVMGRLVRRYVTVGGKERQINIYGRGKRDGREVLIVGEAKVRPSRKEVDRFVRLARRLAEAEGREPFLLFVAYDFPPAIEAYVRDRGVLPIWSYELAV